MNATFEQPTPSAHGMATPYFIARISYEHPGYTAIELHPHEVCACGFLTVGDAGLQMWRSLKHWQTGESPENTTDAGEIELKLNGWKAREVWCDQTGGMVMVDVIEFENGHVLTLTPECAVLWSSKETYLGDENDHQGLINIDL